MEPWRQTFDEFIAASTPTGNNATPLDEMFQFYSWAPSTINDLGGDYATAQINQSGTDCVLLHRAGGAWSIVGFYVDSTIYVTPAHRKGRPTEELMLRCLDARAHPGKWQLTEAGHSLLKRVHQLSVERAHAAKLDVPEEVLAEYGLVKPA